MGGGRPARDRSRHPELVDLSCCRAPVEIRSRSINHPIAADGRCGIGMALLGCSDTTILPSNLQRNPTRTAGETGRPEAWYLRLHRPFGWLNRPLYSSTHSCGRTFRFRHGTAGGSATTSLPSSSNVLISQADAGSATNSCGRTTRSLGEDGLRGRSAFGSLTDPMPDEDQRQCRLTKFRPRSAAASIATSTSSVATMGVPSAL